MKPVLLIPLVLFVVLVFFLSIGLFRDPRVIESVLIGKPAPEFQLAQLQAPEKTISVREMRGKVWLLNAWGSWCVTCREEHPYLIEYARTGEVPIYGLNYKDNRSDASAMLSEMGNPYVLSAYDPEGRTAIDFGVYAAPESFLIDKEGVIRFKQIGAITPNVWRDKILPLARQLNNR